MPAIRSVRMIQSLTSCMRLHYLTLYFSSSFSQFMSRTSEAKPEMMMIKSVSSQQVPTGYSNLLCAIWENMNLNWRFVTSVRVGATRLCARTRPSSFGMTKYKRSLFEGAPKYGNAIYHVQSNSILAFAWFREASFMAALRRHLSFVLPIICCLSLETFKTRYTSPWPFVMEEGAEVLLTNLYFETEEVWRRGRPSRDFLKQQRIRKS